jgi:hypothetical protein
VIAEITSSVSNEANEHNSSVRSREPHPRAFSLDSDFISIENKIEDKNFEMVGFVRGTRQ